MIKWGNEIKITQNRSFNETKKEEKVRKLDKKGRAKEDRDTMQTQVEERKLFYSELKTLQFMLQAVIGNL